MVVQKFCAKGSLISEVGMAIPRRISLLEESRNRGMAIYQSSGIEEGKIYSSRNRGFSRNENSCLFNFYALICSIKIEAAFFIYVTLFSRNAYSNFHATLFSRNASSIFILWYVECFSIKELRNSKFKISILPNYERLLMKF